MSSSLSQLQTEKRQVGSTTVVYLSGVIDEHADLSGLAGLAGQVELNMRGIRRINSYGVRTWIDAIRGIPASTDVTLTECPSVVVDQLNMVRGFAGHAHVKSFYAPLSCEDCDEHLSTLVDAADCLSTGRIPRQKCRRCGREMDVDDLEEQYLLFLREQRPR